MLPHGERRALLLNDFPVELLRQIFSWMLPARQLIPSQPRVAPAWLVCTGICRYWRDVVHGDPTFWTHIDLGPTEWLALCLERSAQMTVAILIRDPDLDLLQMEPIIDPHMDRIKYFHKKSAPCGPPFIYCPMRQLEHLDVAISHHHQPGDPAKHGAMCPRLPVIPGEDGSFPRLRSVVLRGISLAVFGHNFCTLRSLTLVDCIFGGRSFDSQSDLLHVLSACPSLEQVCLMNSLLLLFKHPEIARVALPNLRTLMIQDAPMCMSYLLRFLDIPVTAHILLMAYVRTEEELVPGLSTVFQTTEAGRGGLPILRSVTLVDAIVDLSSPEPIRITGIRDRDDPFTGGGCIEIALRYGPQGRPPAAPLAHHPEPVSTIFRNLHRIFPAGTPVEILACHTDVNKMHIAEYWKEALEPYDQTLRALVLEDCMSSGDARSIITALGDPRSQACERCPNLRTLWIRNVAVFPELMEGIRTCVQGRADREHPLPALRLDMVEETACGINVGRDPKYIERFPAEEELVELEEAIDSALTHGLIVDIHEINVGPFVMLELEDILDLF